MRPRAARRKNEGNKMNIAVIDTETIGDFAHPLVYDFSYVIFDNEKDYAPIVQKERIVKELQTAGLGVMSESQWYRDKRVHYENRIRVNPETLMSWKDILKELESVCAQYNVTAFAGYNFAFDVRAIENTSVMFQYPFHIEPNNCIDIMRFACETVLNTRKYRNFCDKYNGTPRCKGEKHGLISSAGNYRATAEACYKFMTGSPFMVESHFGIDDALQEAWILAELYKVTGKEPTKGFIPHVWRLIQPVKIAKETMKELGL